MRAALEAARGLAGARWDQPDDSTRLKGRQSRRPEQSAEMLAALEAVDLVVIFRKPYPCA
jgi:bifunctional ADP-heptose synthase (sugar kinase/adenylyltransferase)